MICQAARKGRVIGRSPPNKINGPMVRAGHRKGQWRSGRSRFVSPVQTGSTILAGAALGKVAIVGIQAAVVAKTPTAIVDEIHFFRWYCMSCVH